jgi:tetratricopeptide (TPR) repeat protein
LRRCKPEAPLARRVLLEACAPYSINPAVGLEDGAICDFTDRLLESAAAIEEAAGLLDASMGPAITARVDNWLGVVRTRQGRSDEASVLLRRAIAAAEAIGDEETFVGSLLMLGGVLRRASRYDEARAAADVAIARSEAHGDVFHLTVGLFNRVVLCRMIGDPSAAERDCARAIEIAERHGYGQMEIAGWLNLSEVYLSMDRDGDALVAARRGFEAARRRFAGHPPVVVTSWLALLEAGLGHTDEARRLLQHIDAAETARSPLLHLRRAAVAAVLGDAPADDLDARVAELEPDDRNAFTWLLRSRCAGVSGPSTPACASAGTR